MNADPLKRKEIPCLSVDKIFSIFRPNDADIYFPGLLIGERSSDVDAPNEISFVHPFSVDAFIFIFCEEGEMTISTSSYSCSIEKHDLYINYPRQIMRVSGVNSCKVVVLVVDVEFIQNINLDIKPMAQKLLALHYMHKMSLSSFNFSELIRLIRGIAEELRNNERDSATNDILRCLFGAMFFKIGRVIDKNTIDSRTLDQEAFNKHAGYFKEFMILLGQNYKKERSVGFYAERMHLSPKYFTTLVKRTSGLTAAEWISRYVILEAKNLLKYSTMNVQEIAYSLNFPNQSFFGKYFKHHTGMTPSEYKKL